MTSASPLMQMAGYTAPRPRTALSSRLLRALGALVVAASAVAVDLDSHPGTASPSATSALQAATPEIAPPPPGVWLLETRAGMKPIATACVSTMTFWFRRHPANIAA